ncbi:neuropeptide SIFamide receptor-like isoform X2 [Ruditapes philippinarum]|uniref:neuropeptide SIFamide receptor-like isoform X2 n=1 Tax=Ruditapes philippinarum TaxID=129788 RepID=UPI00295C0E09|nr:neuropeptide SIFamide receptor-like isoform X2 [Ruditapes philippinarum]
MIEETMDVHDNSSVGYLSTYINQRVIETSTMSQHDVIDNVTVVDVPLIKQPEHMIIVYCVSYVLVFVIGLIGNSFVIAVIYKDPSMRNVTNYFILNMSVADIIIAVFCVPFTLLGNIYSGWRYGAFLCKITPYVQSVVQCASVNTLAAIAFDRYLAICYTRHSKISTCASRTTIASIWIFAGSIMIPLLVFYQKYMHPKFHEVPMCHQLWPNFDLQRGYFLVALFCVCYLLPLIMILLCYILIAVKIWKRNAPGVQTNGRLIIYKSKVKVLKMLAVIVILFAFSWLPLYAIYLKFYFQSEDLSEGDQKTLFEIVLPFAQWLGASNCGMNPIIYCFFSKKYRRGFKKLLYCRFQTLAFRRQSRTTRSLSTRYINVENSSGNVNDTKNCQSKENKVSSNKYMVVAFNNGRMTVSFRKENASDDSSF